MIEIIDDHPREECAVTGIYGHPEAANMAYLNLYALQHRGQESSGITTSNGKKVHSEVGMGLVSDIFNKERLSRLQGHIAIGHNRYSTAGHSNIENAQPLTVVTANQTISLAHNGNLINGIELRKDLEKNGSIFRTTTDSEAILHLIAKSKEEEIENAIIEALRMLKGAFALTIMTHDKLFGIRDPNGFRPLVLGKVTGSKGEIAWVMCSETCALDLMDAEFVREVEPGEMVVIGKNGLESYKPFPETKITQCIFEFIYFARPDSFLFGHNAYTIRKQLGAELAKESEIDADLVVPVPDSGLAAALGYSNESGIPLEMGLVRNHYVGRTFIEPQQSIRHFGVKIKLNPIKNYLTGKKVVVIDDSIVRGTTSNKIVEMIRNAGAKEVHMKISSPPITNPCFFGIDMPSKKELIASSKSPEQIRDVLEVDSLSYLSIEGLLKCVSPNKDDYCIACFNGDYPIPVEQAENQLNLFKNISISEHRG